MESSPLVRPPCHLRHLPFGGAWVGDEGGSGPPLRRGATQGHDHDHESILTCNQFASRAEQHANHAAKLTMAIISGNGQVIDCKQQHEHRRSFAAVERGSRCNAGQLYANIHTYSSGGAARSSPSQRIGRGPHTSGPPLKGHHCNRPVITASSNRVSTRVGRGLVMEKLP